MKIGTALILAICIMSATAAMALPRGGFSVAGPPLTDNSDVVLTTPFGNLIE